jgi:mannose-6-phosphate isomerase-like protein (cupin superfamily)
MTDRPDRRKVAADWAARGFGCDIWTDRPGQVWADFVHATDELVMLVDGAIELRFAGRVLQPRPGEEVLIPAGVPHTVINTGSTTNHWLYGYKRG